MPLILVVTKDDRVPGRVREALGPGGWNVAHVHGLTEAMQEVASEAPDLFLVASELDGADNVLTSFARRQGGPGTIALGPAGAPGAAAARGADAALPRTFDAGALREVVERVLKTGDRPARPAEGEPKLTSADIFGDLVAEVESEAREFPSRPAAAPEPPRPARRSDDDIERKLEETLSGVLGRGPKPKPAAAVPPAPQAPPPAGPAAPVPRPPSKPARGDDDLDKLISDTLSGLEPPGGRKKRTGPPAPASPPREGSRPGRAAGDEFDLDDFQALLDRPRRPPRPAAPPASPPSPPPAETGPPREEPPFQPRFADAMEEVADEPPLEAPAAGEAAPPAERPAAPGTEFGQYRLLERIGVGGMAEVWKARMTGVEGFQKTVAIKRILPHLTDSSDFVEMFVDEAKLAAQLNHANIIHIYDLGKISQDYYIAMEHVEGENLRRILQRAREKGRPLPAGLAVYVAARLASALDHAHRKRDFDDRELGLVHRDVSPQNVLVGYEGTIKLCDFGIVKAVSKSSHTQRGALKGKLQYMSPEQAWGRPVDGRSDIFSLGALLFEMLTGRRLFVGESEMEVLEAVRECQVVPPSELEPRVPEEVDAVVLEALRSDPEERFQSAGELGRRLEEILAGMRPTPGQDELAAYMTALFDRAAVEAPPEAAPPPEKAGVPLPGAGAATVPIPVAAARAAAEAPGGTGTGTGTSTGTGASAGGATGSGAVRAVEPVGKVEPEEGGLRGKWLLVAAIVAALLLGGVLAWYFVLGPGAAEEGSGARPPAAGEEAAAPVVPAGPVEPPGEGVEEGVAAEAEDGASGPSEEGGDEALGPEDLPQDIEERLAEREEALRRQFEAELASREQALQERLSELQEAPVEEPPPAPAAKAPAPAPEPAPAPAKAPPPAEPAAKAAAETPAATREEPEEQEVEEVSAPEEAAPAPADQRAPRGGARPAPPPAPAPRPEPKAPPEPVVRQGELVTMGPGVVPPKLVRFEKPEYPPIARRLRAEGEVVISVLVDETGKVIDTRVVQRASQDAGLEEAALEAARSATYQPATKNGVRVKMWTTLRIPFRL